MKKRMLIVNLIAILCFLSYQVSAFNAVKERSQNRYFVKKTYVVNRFKSLEVTGGAVVTISKGRSKQITVEGDPRIVKACYFQLRGAKLFVNTPSGASSRARVKIIVPSLDALTLRDEANVIATNLLVMNVNLIQDQNLRIRLRGQIFAHQTNISQRQAGMIFVEWLDSDNIAINAVSEGLIRLSGSAGNLLARSSQKTYLDAKYMNAKNVFINASGESQAYFSPVTRMRAFTKDRSGIYYYTKPEYISIFSANSSNVLLLKTDNN